MGKPRHVERREKTDYVVMRANNVLRAIKIKKAKDALEKEAAKDKPDAAADDAVAEGANQKKAEELATAAAAAGEKLKAAQAAHTSCEEENAEAIADGNLDECDETHGVVKDLEEEVVKLGKEAEAAEAEGKDAVQEEA